jgi:NitT/TauT family transport system ATP-binding protein
MAVDMAKIDIQNLKKVFPPPKRDADPVTAITDISVEIEGNVFVSVVGPSGCGKSTLLNILSDVETPTSGSVTVTEGDRAARLGYVFQDARLLPWRTVMENMMYVRDDEGSEAQAAATHYLDMVGLGHTHDMFPGQLSGGMQQRVGIARAFSVEPDLLLMDEPFSHLDAITARSLRDHLQVLWAATRKTVLFVTHDVVEAVQLSDRIIVLAPGGTVFDDISIDLEHPRRVTDPKVATLQAEILARFEEMHPEPAAADLGTNS